MENLKGKRLLILGGSRISCEIISHARQLGIITGVVDWYPIEKSPAKLMADEAYIENTSDIEAIVKLIKEKKFDGVLTGFTDSVLPYYAQICEKAGLPTYGTKDQFEIFIDKKKYKELLKKFNVPTIPDFNIDKNNYETIAPSLPFPVIVKPSDSSGSRGITVCNNKEEFINAVKLALESSKYKEFLVEQYLDKEEVTIFWIFQDGKYNIPLLGNRHIKTSQEGELPLPVGYTYPASILPFFLEKTAPKMERMFKAIGIKNGMMFMQCKVVNKECLVYDIGYRLTGSLEYENIKASSGIDPMNMLINFALSGEMGEKDLEQKIDPYLKGKYSFNVSILCKPGKIKEIIGLDEVNILPGVIHTYVSYLPGEEITEEMRGRLAQITVRVLGNASSIDEMKYLMFKIHDTIKVISDKNENLVIPGIEESDFESTYIKNE